MKDFSKMSLSELFKEYREAVECRNDDLADGIEALACQKFQRPEEKKEEGHKSLNVEISNVGGKEKPVVQGLASP